MLMLKAYRYHTSVPPAARRTLTVSDRSCSFIELKCFALASGVVYRSSDPRLTSAPRNKGCLLCESASGLSIPS